MNRQQASYFHKLKDMNDPHIVQRQLKLLHKSNSFSSSDILFPEVETVPGENY
jgi:hypothetical protein